MEWVKGVGRRGTFFVVVFANFVPLLGADGGFAASTRCHGGGVFAG